MHLFEHETNEAYQRWGLKNDHKHNIVIAPGGGFPEKCWGDTNYSSLTKNASKRNCLKICIVGSKEDRRRIQVPQSNRLKNLCGELSLRQSAALVSTSDFVITNTSFCMHLAGAV